MVEADVLVAFQVEAELLQSGHADLDRTLPRVCGLERRQSAHIRAVVRRRRLLTVVPEQAVEPLRAQPRVRLAGIGTRLRQGALELVERHLLLVLAAFDGIGDARELALERLPLREQVEPALVELGVAFRLELPQLLALPVRVEHGEPGLRGTERQLLALPRDAGREDPVLELVVLLGDLRRREAGLTCLTQPKETLALVLVGRFVLTPAQQLELVAREQVLVARDDRRLLGRLLLSHAHGATLLGALVQVALEALLVLGRASNGRHAHVIYEST